MESEGPSPFGARGINPRDGKALEPPPLLPAPFRHLHWPAFGDLAGQGQQQQPIQTTE